MSQIFSERLALLRSERGLTQEGLARALNGTRSTMSGYETSGKEPDFEMLCTFARFFGVSSDYLLGLSDEKNHVDHVFFGDAAGFSDAFDVLPEALRPLVGRCFRSFYMLIGRDVRLASGDQLDAYAELFETLQKCRSEIRSAAEQIAASSDPAAVSSLLSRQSRMKNSVSALLDQLLQNDIDAARGRIGDEASPSAGVSGA